MTPGKRLKVLGVTAAFSGFALAGMLLSSPRGRALDHDDDDERDPRIEKGFDIAPVHLDLEGKNRNLVGLGSYIVNALADCDGCHSAGPRTEFFPGSNPYFIRQTGKINPATYLGGGRDFLTLVPCNPPTVPCSAHIISRNLTPTPKTGLPEGDHTFAEFKEIMRTGKDFDHLHPTCPMGTVNAGCIPAPFDGELLQIMPWPIQKNMSDHDIRAIYEYLKAIPCIQGNYPGPNGLAQGIPPEPADRCK
jgi:hypothetical protein